MLSTAHHELDGDSAPDGIYKSTHVNHPSAVWVMQSREHYKYVFNLLIELGKLYTRHTGKTHKTSVMASERLSRPPLGIPTSGFVDPPVAAPDEFKAMVSVAGTVGAYKAYLNHKFKEWQSRPTPLSVSWYTSTPSWYYKRPKKLYIRVLR